MQPSIIFIKIEREGCCVIAQSVQNSLKTCNLQYSATTQHHSEYTTTELTRRNPGTYTTLHMCTINQLLSIITHNIIHNNQYTLTNTPQGHTHWPVRSVLNSKFVAVINKIIDVIFGTLRIVSPGGISVTKGSLTSIGLCTPVFDCVIAAWEYGGGCLSYFIMSDVQCYPTPDEAPRCLFL